MSDRDEALRLASEVDRDTGCLPSVEIERNDQWIERFYQLCRDKFAGKDWRQQAYIYLGYMRDRMSSQDVEVVQDFLGPLISTAPENEPAPTEGATPAQEFHCSVSIHGPCQVYLAKDYNELRERVKELEKAAEPALRYIQHVGSNQAERGLPHPQQWIVDLLIAAIAKEGTKP